jgi:hypothetical protein
VELEGLLVGLDALGHDPQLEGLAEADDGVAEGGVLGVEGDPVDERLVQLEDVEGEAAQVAEGRVAGAEVVNGQPDAERLEGVVWAACQWPAWRQASRRTQLPMASTWPVSSARGMNSAGETAPRTGCCQRTRASRPTIRPVRRSMVGW